MAYGYHGKSGELKAGVDNQVVGNAADMRIGNEFLKASCHRNQTKYTS